MKSFHYFRSSLFTFHLFGMLQLKDLMVVNNVFPSAYNKVKHVANVYIFFMYIINNKGPMIDSCVTPMFIDKISYLSF